MKIFIFIFACYFGLAFSAFAQMYFPELLFQKFYGTPQKEQATCMVVDADTNIYLAGNTYAKSATECTNGYLIKVSPEGNLMWENILDGMGCDAIHDIVSIPHDSSIVIAGASGLIFSHPEQADTFEAADFLVSKLNYQGKVLWKKSLGGSYKDVAHGLAPTPYGGVIVAGNSWSMDFDANHHSFNRNDAWYCIINKNGELIRNNRYGGLKNDWAQDIIKTKENDYVLVGFTNSENLDNAPARMYGDAWILKVDFAGNKLWERILTEPYENNFLKVVENPYGFIYACGYAFVEGKGYQFWLVKFDKLGNPLFNRKWGDSGHEVLTSIYPTHDGGLIMTGFSFYEQLENSYIKGDYDCWVIRTDAFGDILWQKTYGGPTYEKGIDVIEYKPHHFFVLAEKHNHFEKSKTSKDNDFWLLSIQEIDCDLVKPNFTMDVKNHFEKMDIPIRFHNQSNYGERFLWDFGDGTYSTERNPVKSYRLPGFYYVTLTVFVNENCYKSFKYPHYITVM